MNNPSTLKPPMYSELGRLSYDSLEIELQDLRSGMAPRSSDPPSSQEHSSWEASTGRSDQAPAYERVASQEYQQSKRRTTRGFRSAWLRNNGWKSEILELVLGLAVLIAIAVLLNEYNGEQQPEWLYSFNLSSIVAVLSTVFRGALLAVVDEVISQLKWTWFRNPRPLVDLSIFDQATRGPWGSLRFLFKLPRPHLATVGALITLLSLATSAFSQQAVRSVPCLKPVSDSAASIPLAQTVNNNSVLFSIYPDDISRPGYGDTVHVDREMKAALVGGLSRPDAIAPPPTACGTGNCTFVQRSGISYSSLGVSSRCVDVSSKITQTSGNKTSFPELVYRLPGGLSISYCDGCYSSTEIYLPNGTHTIAEIPGTWSTLFNATTEQYDQEPLEYNDISIAGMDVSNAGAGFLPAFTHVSMMMPTRRRCQSLRQQGNVDGASPDCDQPTLNVTSLPEDFGLMAAVCWLYPSIIDFQGQIVNGQLIETQVGDATPLASSSPSNRTTFDQADVYKFQDPCYVNGSRYDITDRNSWPGSEVDTVDIVDMLSNTTVTGPKHCLYGLGYEYVAGLFQMAQQVFTEDQCVPTVNYESIMCQSWWLGSFWNGRDATLKSVSAVMDGAAKALTNRIRTIGEDYNRVPTRVDGTATQLYVCTDFSWPWLLFPAVMLIGTAALLIAMLIKSSTEGGSPPTWKSSLLPLLVYGFEEQTKAQNLMEAPQLNELIKGVEVSFRTTADGPRFVPGNTDREPSERNLITQE
ncbi:hypothetical protein F4818DRAFT_54350 [Hypoxylon cercidicola]|nr:hypothetical protein F4818DRAFT_54350 [Hypoxylon cercidicola]